MTISPHLLTGAAIATQTDSAIVAFLLGFTVHFILDAIPHLDPGTFIDPVEPHSNRNLNMDTVHSNDRPWPGWIRSHLNGYFRQSDFPFHIKIASFKTNTLAPPPHSFRFKSENLVLGFAGRNCPCYYQSLGFN